MSEFKVFGAGIPTLPDVDNLHARFGIPQEGVVIKWTEIESVLACGRTTCRFKTVVDAWRKSLEKKHGFALVAERGVGLVRPIPDTYVETAGTKARSAMRFIGRSIKFVGMADRNRLSDQNKKAADHFTRLGANIQLAALSAAKGIALPSLEKA